VDVVEIDGASNNGVEAVRAIRDNVAYGAATGKYKIYIIDEVHMLSLSAFNALLKTLEEPPANVVFIFATTEVQKIPLTILGRCQRFEFRRLSQVQVIERLKHVLNQEKIVIEEEGLRIIASYSDGSLRDALSLLDQVLSFFSGEEEKKNPLTEKQIVESLGITDTNTAWGLIEAIFNKNQIAALNLVKSVYDSGADLKSFAERVLEQLRLLYLQVVALENQNSISADELDISSGHFNRVQELAKKTSILQVERCAQILGKTIQQLSWASLPLFNLEMAVVRMCKLEDLAKIEQGLLNGSPLVLDTVAENVTEKSPEPLQTEPEKNWKGFVDFVMKKRPLLGALLSHAQFRLQDKNQFVISFPEGSFYKKQAAEPKNTKDIEAGLKAYFGPDTTHLLESDVALVEPSLVEAHDAKVQEIKKSAVEHEAVKEMKELLGAEVVDVEVNLRGEFK